MLHRAATVAMEKGQGMLVSLINTHLTTYFNMSESGGPCYATYSYRFLAWNLE